MIETPPFCPLPLFRSALIAAAVLLSACSANHGANHGANYNANHSDAKRADIKSAGISSAGINGTVLPAKNQPAHKTDTALPLDKDTQSEFEMLLSSLDGKSATPLLASQGRIVAHNAAPNERILHNVEIKSRLLKQYSQWKGVRYRLGGKSQRGIDCSAFVQRTFLEQFGIDLPRSTRAQQTSGKRIARNKLRTGDLVLFNTGPGGRHVGIYIGNNRFVHASTSKGVIISDMDNPFWKKRYHEARRILTQG